MADWSVDVEGRAPEGAEPIRRPEGAQLALSEALGTYATSIAVEGRSWSASLSIASGEASDARAAAELGHALVSAAVTTAGIAAWPVVRLDAHRNGDQEESAPAFPEVVGDAEVLRILGISKQYFGQLQAAGRFPKPVVELKATSIWLRSDVDAFHAYVSLDHATSCRRPDRAHRSADRFPVRAGREEGRLAPRTDAAWDHLKGNFNLRPAIKP